VNYLTLMADYKLNYQSLIHEVMYLCHESKEMLENLLLMVEQVKHPSPVISLLLQLPITLDYCLLINMKDMQMMEVVDLERIFFALEFSF
jgi:hypothetical protein